MWHASHWTSHLTPLSASSHAWSLEQHSNGSLSVLGCPGCKVTSTAHANAKPAQTPFFFRNFAQSDFCQFNTSTTQALFLAPNSNIIKLATSRPCSSFLMLLRIRAQRLQVWWKPPIQPLPNQKPWYLTTPQREFFDQRHTGRRFSIPKPFSKSKAHHPSQHPGYYFKAEMHSP